MKMTTTAEIVTNLAGAMSSIWRELDRVDCVVSIDCKKDHDGRSARRYIEVGVKEEAMAEFVGPSDGSELEIDWKWIGGYARVRRSVAPGLVIKTLVWKAPIYEGHPKIEAETADDAEILAAVLERLEKMHDDYCEALYRYQQVMSDEGRD